MSRSPLGRWAVAHSKAVVFVVFALCLGGAYSAVTTPSSVFPQTNFPRVVILVDNGVMPADEMMATITRPIEEAMKDIPGATSIRSATGRGSAEVNVFFTWKVDMVRSELHVLGRLSQIRSTLPATATTTVHRLTFSAFPIIGVSLTSPDRRITELWEVARYNLKPRFLRIPGVARVDLVGGRVPEVHVVVDPDRLAALDLGLDEVREALARTNVLSPTGMHEENHLLYLAVVDGRVHSREEIEGMTVAWKSGRPVRIGDFATVRPGAEPVFNVVTAEGVNAVLLNVRSQPDGSTLDIAEALKREIREVRRELPADMKLAFFYDQSLMVRESVASVWEAIIFGLALSIVILYLFLKDWGTTMVAALVIPVTVLVTLVAMKVSGLSFNLMTMGGIAAAIGLVIDDAIVVVEAIHTRVASGVGRREAIARAIGDIFHPLVGSTLTPVVVFIPLAFLEGITGVFFRALAMTMVVSLLTSLVLAVSLTPSLAAWLIREGKSGEGEGGPILRRVIGFYETVLRGVLRHPGLTLAASVAVLLGGVAVYHRLESDFLPAMDEGGFVIDYVAEPGTSLSETNAALLKAEAILNGTPDVDSFSRRTGARLALAIAEPNTGDFLVKLKPDRSRSTEEVIGELRDTFNATIPGIEWEFPGILGDLIGDLTWSPEPIEIKIFSTDTDFLKEKAPQVKEAIEGVRGVVDTFDGLIDTGPSLSLRVRAEAARRFGMGTEAVAQAVETAMLGQTASYVVEGDRVVNIRVGVDPARRDTVATLLRLPIRVPNGSTVQLSQLADVREVPGQLEMRREDLRQNVAVTARLEKRDMGSAMDEIRAKIGADPSLPPGVVEYGGLYKEQQESFRNLLGVLVLAVLLVLTVLLFEFRSFLEPLSIIFGSVLALVGTVLGLWVTGISLNVISFLGAIIGVGIVAKNGILMLDLVDQHRAEGMSLEEALVRSGRRRLRPVFMTSMTTMLGMIPLGYGLGSGADMLKPLAISVIGALCISVLLSLVATPNAYLVLVRVFGGRKTREASGQQAG